MIMLFVVSDTLLSCEVSCYANKLSDRHYERQGTASGIPYKSFGAYTCATIRIKINGHYKPKYPFGSFVKIISNQNRLVIVKITDTGSYKPKKSRDWFDCNNESYAELYPYDREPSRHLAKFKLVSKQEYLDWLEEIKTSKTTQ